MKLFLRRSTGAARATIVCLFFFRRPAAVGFGVALAVVHAIQRVLCGGAFAHVRQEGDEGRAPFWADCNAAGTVMFEHLLFRIFAALNHGAPRMVFTGLPLAVRGVHTRVPFRFVAPTRLRAAALQRRALHGFQFATVAPTGPSRRLTGPTRRDTRQCGESTESLSRQVEHCKGHSFNSTVFGVK